MAHAAPLSPEEPKHPRRPAHLIRHERLSPLERFAASITATIGTMGFFLIILVWTVVWFLWNTLAPREFVFDPFPAFVLWIFISNMLQLFFLPLLMVGQKLQNRYADLRAEADFEVNQKAEREIEAILAHLDRQHTKIEAILERLPADSDRPRS